MDYEIKENIGNGQILAPVTSLLLILLILILIIMR